MAENSGLILKREDCINDTCPWSGDPVSDDSLTSYKGMVVGFCNPGCRDKFEAAIKHFDAIGETPADHP